MTTRERQPSFSHNVGKVFGRRFGVSFPFLQGTFFAVFRCKSKHLKQKPTRLVDIGRSSFSNVMIADGRLGAFHSRSRAVRFGDVRLLRVKAFCYMFAYVIGS